MESKISDSVLGVTEVRKGPADEVQTGDRKKRAEEGYGNKKVELDKNYDAISRNGDTLELSEKGKRLGEHPNTAQLSPSGKQVFSDTGKKISDNVLMGYSKAKLRQLYANKEITKQSYDRIMSKKK